MLGVLIVGAGNGGSSLLRAFANISAISMVAIADHNPLAPGLTLAKSLGVPTALDFRTVVGHPDVDLVVQATGDPRLDADIQRLKQPRARVIEGLTMNLILSLVDEEERLVRTLQSREREQEVILNSTHDGMLAVNARGVVTICNAAAERLMGIQRSAVLGKLASEVIPNTRLHLVLRSGQGELNQQQRVGDITIITNRVPVRDDMGRLMGAVAIFRDITDIKQLADEISGLKQIRLMLEAIIYSTQDAISVVDENGRQLYINPAYTAITGLRQEQVIGKPPTVDIGPGQDSMLLQVLRTGQPVKSVPMKVGPRKRDVLVNAAPIVVDGVVKGSVGVIHDITEIKRLSNELESFKQQVRRLTSKYTFDEIVANSAVMQAAVEQAQRAAQTPATVLLRGESGTGKELFAHAIHNASNRRGGQFIRVNCAALTDSLLESELFGYVEGAFTGARKGGHRGLFEEAQDGTIFLDEIGEVSLNLQAKLLRVLQEKEIIRVGDNRPIPVNVRIIAATNAPLEDLIAKGTFREDLYYRLNVVPIVIPPLRHRAEDIPALAEHMVERFNQEYGRYVRRIAPEALAQLQSYRWSGNVRELENVIGRAMIAMQMSDTVLEPQFLPPLTERNPGSAQAAAARQETAAAAGQTLDEVVGAAEKSYLLQTLSATAGNKTEAARRLGISPRTLYYKLERHGLM